MPKTIRLEPSLGPTVSSWSTRRSSLSRAVRRAHPSGIERSLQPWLALPISIPSTFSEYGVRYFPWSLGVELLRHGSTVGEHGATAPKDFKYEQNVFGAAAAEMYIDTCNSLINMANTERSLLQIQPKNMKICFDEWNVWDDKKGHAKNGLEQWYDYSDMLGFVAWLHVLVRKHKEVAIACLAQTVNVVGPVAPRETLSQYCS